MSLAVRGDRQVDLVHLPLRCERDGDLLERHVVVVGVCEDDLWPAQRVFFGRGARPEREGVAVVGVGRHEGLEAELAAPVGVERARHRDKEPVAARVRRRRRLHDHLHLTLRPRLEGDGALLVAFQIELQQDVGGRRRRRRWRVRWRRDQAGIDHLELVKVVDALEASHHDVSDHVVSAQLEGHDEVDVVLVPKGRQLHEVAVDVLVVGVLILEGDVRPGLWVASGLGPERERVHAFVVGYEEGRQAEECVEVLLKGRGDLRLVPILALVGCVGAREVGLHAALGALPHDALHALRASLAIQPEQKAGRRRRRGRRWRRHV